MRIKSLHITFCAILFLHGCSTHIFHGDGLPHFSHAQDIKPVTQADRLDSPTQLVLDIHFETNSDKIEPVSMANLDELALLAKKYAAKKVVIVGRTDNRDTREYNMQLSLRRAQRVADYIKSHAIPGERIELSAMGEMNPASTNTTPRGRALNRRTWVKVVF